MLSTPANTTHDVLSPAAHSASLALAWPTLSKIQTNKTQTQEMERNRAGMKRIELNSVELDRMEPTQVGQAQLEESAVEALHQTIVVLREKFDRRNQVISKFRKKIRNPQPKP
jgi:hypothetical protein